MSANAPPTASPPRERPRRRPAGEGAPPPAAPRRAWWSSTWFLGLLGSGLLFAAFPPFDLWPLAWVAPIPWLVLCLQAQLTGRRPYLALWLAGLAHWLLMLEGIRLAHPVLYLGWFALAAYLAVYLPAFVGLTRVAVHRLRLPLAIAAPVVWIGLELARGHLITGFSMGLLGHTQIRWTALLQIADLAGAYAVSGVVLAVAAAAAEGMGALLPRAIGASSRGLARPLASAAVALLAVLGAWQYGEWRLAREPAPSAEKTLRAALIQGSLDTVLDVSPARVRETFEQYGALTRQALAERDDLDLIVWPESMFCIPEIRVNGTPEIPADAPLTEDEFRLRMEEVGKTFRSAVADAAASFNATEGGGRRERPVSFLFGSNTHEYGPHPPRSYNCALLADEQGQLAGRYYKQHLVMFGEYIPGGELCPWIYRISPLPAGLRAGDQPQVFRVAGWKLSPCVCFESTVPHLIRRQVNALAERGEEPDLLVNVSNDGWFRGASILDLQLRCAVLRAVENRKPVIIAANTGFSAQIDGSGRILQQGPRRATQVLQVDVRPDGRQSLYRRIGDWPTLACLAACGLLAGLGLAPRFLSPTPASAPALPSAPIPE